MVVIATFLDHETQAHKNLKGTALGKPGTPANPAKRTALNAIKPRGNTSRSVSTATSGGLHGSRSHLCNGPVEGRGVLKQPAIRDVGLAAG